MLAPSGYLINNSRAINSVEREHIAMFLPTGTKRNQSFIYLALKAHHVASDQEPVPGAA